jgi:MFS transporter, OFA family, oxalate/formate antiporter
VVYVTFGLVATGGLMLAASLAPIAKDFKIDKTTVDFAWIALPALSFALSLDRVLDGIGRPFFGWVSDRIGREHTMFIAFCIGAGALFALSQVGTDPLSFVLFSGLYFGVFGEIYSLFPATQTDTFGSKFAAANAGLLYTAKGTGSLMVPLAAYVAKQFGWPAVFWVAIGFNLTAACIALFVVKPMRRAQIENNNRQVPAQVPGTAAAT